MSEPFTGPHWGPGYNEEVLEGWTESEGSETSSASDEEVVTPSTKVVGLSKAARARLEEKRKYEEAETRLAEARLQLDKLKDGAYWKQDGASVNPVKAGLYGWWEMTTGEPSPYVRRPSR
jgi:gamma-tubulin complex component 5